MAKPLPEFAEVKFIEALATGTVHIDVQLPSWLIATQEPEVSWKLGESGGQAFRALYETPTVTRCGLKTHPHRVTNPRHQYTNRFSDDQLCAACYRTLAPADQQLAFEHEQPGDEDDEEQAA